MDNFYLKYAEELPYPYPSIQKMKEQYLTIWKKNILNELSILKNLFLEKYSSFLEEKLKKLIENIASLIEEYRYSFLENYLYYLNTDDRFYININDEQNNFKIKFLKEIYNSILLLIDNLCSSNKIIPLIYEDKLINLSPKKSSSSENLKIQINNEEFFNKFAFDINKIQSKLDKNKIFFNFNKTQDNLYPNDKELKQLFDEFNKNNCNKNLELENQIKKCNNKIIKEKLISKQTDIVIKQNNAQLYELLTMAKTIQGIKNDIKNIKEKQNIYCASSLIDTNKALNEFNNIKNNTMKINSEINDLKNGINEYNRKYLNMINDIENHDKKYLDIKMKNDEINEKINLFIQNIK